MRLNLAIRFGYFPPLNLVMDTTPPPITYSYTLKVFTTISWEWVADRNCAIPGDSMRAPWKSVTVVSEMTVWELPGRRLGKDVAGIKDVASALRKPVAVCRLGMLKKTCNLSKLTCRFYK